MLFTHRAKVFSVVLLLVSVSLLGGFAYFKKQADQARMAVQALQEQKAISTRQRNELKTLVTRKDALREQLTLLTGLRGGATAGEMFQTIDRAIEDDQVWFLSWKYRRAGSVVKPEQQTRETGYFIVLPKGEKNTVDEAWQIETHMTITGQAVDHSALSQFVLRLINQPEILDVRVLNTASRNSDEARLVEFNLAVSVAGEGRNS